MLNHPLKILTRSTFLTAAIIFTAGCSLIKDDNGITKKKDEIGQRQKYYTTLTEDIADGNLKKGATTRTVRTLYGEPDDTVFSNSGTSRFEIWTYEKILKIPNDTEWQPIRLYFNDQKLVSWQH